MVNKKVNVVVSWKYTDTEKPDDAEPDNEATVVWRDMEYCAMVEIEARLIEVLVDLNNFAKGKCEEQSSK